MAYELIGAAVAAAAAAAAAAQQQAAQARQRRQAADAAQRAKQGEQPGAGPASSVAEGIMGQLSQGLSNPRIQDLVMSQSKKVAGQTQGPLDNSLATKPLGGAPPPPMQGPPMQDGSFQSAAGGQQPDYLKWMQMQQGMPVGGNY